MSLIKQLAGETLIYGVGRVLGKILHFVFIAAYLTRIFKDEPELFGIYTDLYFWVALIYILFTHRMETTLFRFGTAKDKRESAYSTAFRSVFMASTIGCLAMFFCSEAIASLLTYTGKGVYVRYFAVIVWFDCLVAIPFARLRLEGKAKKFAIFNILNVLVMITSFLFFFELAPRLADCNIKWLSEIYQLEYRLDYVFISNIISSAVLFVLLFPGLKIFRASNNGKLWKKMLRYAWPLIIVALAGVINQSVSAPLQKIFLSPDIDSNMESVGIYGACLRLAVLLNLFTTAYNFAAEPFFFKRREASDSLEVYADATRTYGIFASLVIGVSLIFLPYIKLIIQENYWSGLFIVPPLYLGFYLLGLYYNFSIWFKLNDRTSVGAILSGIGAIISIVLSIILLPRIGLVGSVIAAVCAYFVMSSMCLIWGRKSFPVAYNYLRLVIYPAIAFAAYGISVYLLPEGMKWYLDFAMRLGLFISLLVIFYGMERDFLRKQFIS